MKAVKLLLLFSAFLTINLLFAGEKKSSWGIRVGYAETDLSVDILTPPEPPHSTSTDVIVQVNNDDYNWNTGKSILVGFSWDYQINRLIEFETGLYFISIGKSSYATLDFDYKVKNFWGWNTYNFEYYAKNEYKLSYLHLPLLFRIAIPYSISPYLEIGPQFGFNLSSKMKSRLYINTSVPNYGDFSDTDQTEEIDLKDQTNFLDYGVVLGIGVKIQPNIYLSGRLYIGLGNVYKEAIDGEDSINNGALLFMAGYNF